MRAHNIWGSVPGLNVITPFSGGRVCRMRLSSVSVSLSEPNSSMFDCYRVIIIVLVLTVIVIVLALTVIVIV